MIYQVYFTICYRNLKPLILFRNDSEWNLELLWCVKSQKCIFLMLFLTLGKRSVTEPQSQDFAQTYSLIHQTCNPLLISRGNGDIPPESDCIWVSELPVLILNKQRSKKNTSVHETEFWERDTEEVQIHDFNCN